MFLKPFEVGFDQISASFALAQSPTSSHYLMRLEVDLYLTDREAFLQVIHKWVGCGAKLNLSKTPVANVLKEIVRKLQKRVLTGVATLLIKVKVHRGDPFNEETDIRAEMGWFKERGRPDR